MNLTGRDKTGESERNRLSIRINDSLRWSVKEDGVKAKKGRKKVTRQKEREKENRGNGEER